MQTALLLPWNRSGVVVRIHDHSSQTIALSTTRRSAWFVQAERHPWAAAGLVIALVAVVALTLAGGQTLLAGKSAASLRYSLGGGLAEGCPHLCVA